MDYKEKYIAVLERAKKLQETCDSQAVVGWCEYLFPELKESEGERIRKAIKSGIKHLETKLGYDAIDGVDILDIYSWLEKQCEKESDPRYKELEDLLEADDIHQMSMNEAMVEKAKSKAVNALSKLGISKLLGLEKQGEQEPYGQRKKCSNCQFNYAGECKGFCQMKKDEQKPIEWSEADEKIRKELIEQVAYIIPNDDEVDSEGDALPTYQKRIDKYRAWLEKQGHMLNAAKVIEWMKHCNITDCDMRTSIIPDSSPTSNPHRVRWFSEDFIDKFKKDFGLC